MPINRFGREGTKPSPILIIDQINDASKENKEFAKSLIREAAACGIVAFLITQKEEWASELAQLNRGTKCKPLPFNVDNRIRWDQAFCGTTQVEFLVLASEESTGLGPLLLREAYAGPNQSHP